VPNKNNTPSDTSIQQTLENRENSEELPIELPVNSTDSVQ
ncbi:MAG: hypothetical protein ACJAX0_001000, partial [Flavobacteriales bacterium]